MKRICAATTLLFALLTAAGCSRSEGAFEIPTGSDVTVEKRDGVKIAGRLVEVKQDQVVVEARDGSRTPVPRREIAAVRAAAAHPAPAAAPVSRAANTAGAETGTSADPVRPAPAPEPPAYREVTIPAGTVVPVELRTGVSSDRSRVEDPVRGTITRAVRIDGVEVLPAGTPIAGHVTAAERSGRVKGRAFVAFRFTAIDPPGDSERVAVRTETVTRFAPATKKADAAKIGGGAAGGAIIGGLLGGGDGAAKGAAIGGAAGTGVVLSTRGKEIRLGPGADVTVRLAAPLTVRVPEGRS